MGKTRTESDGSEKTSESKLFPLSQQRGTPEVLELVNFLNSKVDLDSLLEEIYRF